MKFVLVLLAVAATYTNAVNPGVEIQVNESFLTYLKNSGLTALAGIIKGQSIGNAGGKFLDGVFEWELTNIKVTGFTAATSDVSLPLTPPHGLTAKVNQVTVTLTADYKLTEHLIFSTHQTGSVDISATADASLDMQIDQQNQRPYMLVGACSSNIDNLHLEFHGGIFNKILDLFKGVISDLVKKEMKGMVCTEITSMVTSTMNPIIQGIPVTTDLYDGFYIDYAVTGSANVVGNTIEAPFVGKVYYTGHENDAAIPQASPMAAIPNVAQHMCFKLDLNEVIGSTAYAGIASGKLNLALTETELISLGLPGLLSCNCTSGPMCLVAYFPGLNKVCGPTQSLGMTISMKVMPVVTSSSQGIIMKFTGEAAFTFNGVPYVTLQAIADAGVAPGGLSFDDWVIKGDIQAQAGTMSVLSKNAAIGDIPVATLNSLWQTVIGLIFQGQLDKLGKQGFHLPTIPQITPQKATFIMSTGSLAVCDNFVLNISK